MFRDDNMLYDTILNDFELVNIQESLDVVLEKAMYFGLTPHNHDAHLRYQPVCVLESNDKVFEFSIYGIEKEAIKAKLNIIKLSIRLKEQ